MPEMSAARFVYRRDVLEALARHGLKPGPDTSPGFLRDCLNDLYRYELRRLRDRLLRKEFPQGELAGRVIDLRRRYPLLSVPVERWLADGSGPALDL
jgi:hypothetical protein